MHATIVIDIQFSSWFKSVANLNDEIIVDSQRGLLDLINKVKQSCNRFFLPERQCPTSHLIANASEPEDIIFKGFRAATLLVTSQPHRFSLKTRPGSD